MLTDSQIAEWKRLAEAATPGPWQPRDCGLRLEDEQQNLCGIETVATRAVAWSSTPESLSIISSDNHEECTHPVAQYDATFIAAAREAVPALIAEVERLRGLYVCDCGHDLLRHMAPGTECVDAECRCHTFCSSAPKG